MHKALYRTWRPQVFDDVVGQDTIVKTLKNQVKTGKPAHAYIFSGSRGIGKTTCSKILAKALNCENSKDGDPCGECETCKAFESGALTDVVEIDAASNNSVDDIREIREEAIYAPAMGKYRVYIIDEAHMLSKSAFNALLKIMEEPPEHVVFILATTETHKIPATILSRCQRFHFTRYTPQDIAKRLKFIADKEDIKLEDDAAELIGSLSDGGMRDAISVLDQCYSLSDKVDKKLVYSVVGIAESEEVQDLAIAILEKDTMSALETVSILHKNSVDFKYLTEQLLKYFRDLMVILSAKNPDKILITTTEDLEKKKQISNKTNLSFVLYCVDKFAKIHASMGSSDTSQSMFEMGLIELTNDELNTTNEALLYRIDSLENKLASLSSLPQKQIKEDISEVIKKEIPKEVPTKKEDSKTPLEAPKDVEKEDNGGKVFHFDEDVKEDEIPLPREEDELPPPEYEQAPPISNASLEVLKKEEPTNATIEMEGPLESWGEIVELLKRKNPPLAVTLEDSTAYIKGDIVFIDAPNTVFLNLMRASDATKESLRAAIFEKTGKKYRLGPVKKGTVIKVKEESMLPDIAKIAKENGIEIEEK